MVYADNAATTKMSRTAIDAMLPYMETHYGNPSSLYRLGQEAAEALQSGLHTPGDHLYLRRQRGRQSGFDLRRPHR